MIDMHILVLGYIWQPGMGICAYQYDSNKLEFPKLDRDGVEVWLRKHAGDLQDIVDFRVVIDDDVDGGIFWANPDNEEVYERFASWIC